MKATTVHNLLFFGALVAGAVRADAVDDSLADYERLGAGPFSASAGEELWQRKFPSADGEQRACTTCHTGDTRRPGRHAVTGKAIEPIAPSANAKRLTDRRQIEKWFTRNCKWTLGRECTPQEKGDLLAFLRTQ